MKKCPFCSEEIQDDAIKCRYCSEFLEPVENAPVPKKSKWFYRNSTLFVSFLFVGPFILPLVWFNPKYSSTKKIVITVIILFITLLLVILTIESFKKIGEYYKILGI